jgi:hypothetical protein
MTYSEAHTIVLAAFLWAEQGMKLSDPNMDHGKLNQVAHLLTSPYWPIHAFNKIEAALISQGIINEEIAEALEVMKSPYNAWEF